MNSAQNDAEPLFFAAKKPICALKALSNHNYTSLINQ
jgi:hypothetical protein